jgi:hypothetical protein
MPGRGRTPPPAPPRSGEGRNLFSEATRRVTDPDLPRGTSYGFQAPPLRFGEGAGGGVNAPHKIPSGGITTISSVTIPGG